MFDIGFTTKDFTRAIWSFVFGALGYVVLVQADVVSGEADWAAIAAGAVTAGLSAVKNLLLADGTRLKG